ncbi:MAG: hypothetical protein M1819_006483 [Sarea resinae]|nr:MAG: hypothetical protein M1819_006483 [Sarea resinae]
MNPATTSLKRPAPGASPMPPVLNRAQLSQAQPALNLSSQTASPQMTDDQYLGWDQNSMNTAPAQYPDAASFNANLYTGMTNGLNQPAVVPGTPSNQLARRPANQSLVATRSGPLVPTNGNAEDPWADLEGTLQQQGPGWTNTEEGLEQLEQRALLAKRDAQSKRKQIPPFVQKLSSFLDESKNTELIRWSDNGDSFVVLDEDEFAKTLIPELFKHNNYASFVRQLNMYGFHKRVGLSDNSMRASEKKHKSPSEYWNPYFKRGHPELLWLIQKPKNPTPASGTKGERKPGHRQGTKSESGITMDGKRQEDDGFEGDFSAGAARPELLLPPGHNRQFAHQELITLPKSELSSVRQELQTIQNQQKQIGGVINRIRAENRHLYEQASAFQTMHDRHENSINAILTFLATFYNRSLDGHAPQNVSNMFPSAMPHDTTGQGNVVDLGDYGDANINAASQTPRSFKRQPLLLKAPPASDQEGARVATVSPADSTSPAAAPPAGPHPGETVPAQNKPYPYSGQARSTAQSGTVEELYEPSIRSSSSPQVKPSPIPGNDIMTLINDANANHKNMDGSQFDFPAALTHFETANGNSPLTAKQRSDMLNLIANDTNAGRHGGNNALMSPNPPPMPSLDQIGKNKEELDMLAKLQAEQDSKVQQLTHLLQPLSPTGSIPGLTDGQYYSGQGDGTGQAPPLDIDQFLNNGDYFADHNNAGLDFPDRGDSNNNVLGADDIDFNFDDLANTNTQDDNVSRDFDVSCLGPAPDDDFAYDGGDRVVETVDSSEATSPENAIDEQQAALGAGMAQAPVGERGRGTGDNPNKRRKQA